MKRRLCAVKLLVDDSGDGADLGAEFLLDLVEVEAVIVGDEVDGKTEVTKAARTTDTMEVGLSVLGKVKVDDDVDGLDVDTACEEIRGDKVAATTVSKVVEDAVAVLLLHAGVDEEARVTEFGDLLGKELDTLHRVAEDDGLVDLETGEEGVETLDLLALIDKGVVLRDTLEGELIHQVNFIGVVEPGVLEGLDGDGEGGREEEDLAGLGDDVAKELVDEGLELGREELVSFVHDEHLALGEVGDGLAGEIDDTARCSDEDVDGVVETDDVVLETGSSGRGHDLHVHVLAQFLADLRRLEGELTRGHEDDDLDLGDVSVDALQGGDEEGGGLSGAVLGTGEDVATSEGDGDGLLLDGRRLLKALFEDAHEELAFQVVVLKVVVLDGDDVLGLETTVGRGDVESGLPVALFSTRFRGARG
mmetsp:Transcript_46946/g.78217  ORF Transcript_46946/g.78217 Transcript_46946/m.78217 type:complete len:419 (-) Transcript_46946:177-1433(-)